MMSRERSVRQQHVNLESFQGKKSETQDRLKVIFYTASFHFEIVRHFAIYSVYVK